MRSSKRNFLRELNNILIKTITLNSFISRLVRTAFAWPMPCSDGWLGDLDVDEVELDEEEEDEGAAWGGGVFFLLLKKLAPGN